MARSSVLLILIVALGCSRDHPLFGDIDAGVGGGGGGGGGGGSGLRLVTIRKDAGPDVNPELRAPCAEACDSYVQCGLVVDCSTSDAAWLELVCERECPSQEWAEGISDANDCLAITEAAHPDAPRLEAACLLDQKTCEDYATHVVDCIIERCPGAGRPGPLRSDFTRACQESTLLEEIDATAAEAVVSTPCSDTDLGRAVQRYIDAELGDECSDRPPVVGDGLTAEHCARACAKQTFASCLPDDPPNHLSDVALCEERCTSEARHTALYTCLGGMRSCGQINFCRDNADDDCLRVCADVAECAGGDDHCGRINRRGQAAYFEDCHASCGGRSAFVFALDDAPDCAAKLGFITDASPDLAAACGD